MDIGYKREYKIKVLVKGRQSFNVTMPAEVIIREAEKRQLTVADFIEQYAAVAEYDNFDGIRYTFKQRAGESDG